MVNISLILLGPLLAIATYLFLGPFNIAGQSVWLRFFLLLDLVYVLLIVGIVLVRILYVLSQELLKIRTRTRQDFLLQKIEMDQTV